MASLYLANVTGDGASPATAWRPAGFDGHRFAVLMVDQVKGRAVVFSPEDGITGTGIVTLLQAADRASLGTLARNTSPSPAQLNAAKTWCTNAGYPVPQAASPTWWQTIHYIAQLVNPTADLSAVRA